MSMLTHVDAVATPAARDTSHTLAKTVEPSSTHADATNRDPRAAVEQAAGAYGAAKRHWGENDPRTVEAHDRLAVVKISSAVQRILDAAPPLSNEQKLKLRAVISTIVPTNSEAGQESA